MPDIVNVFEKYEPVAYPFAYEGTMYVSALCGGVPSDPNIAEAWLRTKITGADEDQISRWAAEYMVERNMAPTEENLKLAIAEINRRKHTNGFARDSVRGIYLRGHQLKAAFKEAVSVAAASPETKLDLRGYGTTNKYVTNYAPEHFFIANDRLYLRHAHDGEARDKDGNVVETWKEGDPFHQPTRMLQTFPMNARIHQTGIQYTEVVEDALFDFDMKCDHPFTEEEWGIIWNTGRMQGIGAQRSQGYGVYTPVRWEQVRGRKVTTSVQGKPSKTVKKGQPGADSDSETPDEG